MSIIRRKNWETEDLMFDVIHDLVERSEVYGLPNIGMYESREEIYFNAVGTTTVGVLPEHLHAVASRYREQGEDHILIRFYQIEQPKKPGDKPLEVNRYVFTPPTQEGTGLTRTALAIALFFFAERGWFKDSGVVDESEAAHEERIQGNIFYWAKKYFEGYEDRAHEIYLEYCAQHLRAREEANKK
jgi:hypothetical protein